MGCVATKLDINDVHPNMFAVNNVDDMGTKLSSGQLEITDTDLILYQKGKQPIKWPLKYLKRYGFEAGLFSFEAGRKTPTGPGVYAFKCRRAEKLFNLLQVRVREQGPDRSSVSLSTLPSGLPGDPGPVSPGLGLETEPGSPVGSFSFGDNPDPSTASAAYINCTLGASPRHSVTSPGPGYLNITQERPNTLAMGADTRHEYENVGPDTQAISPGYVPPRLPPPMADHPPSVQPPVTETGEEEERGDVGVTSINYIVLDLDPASTSEASAVTPASKTWDSVPNSTGGAPRARGYVTIDFDKTDALIKSANHRYFNDDPGIRKTRHNSSLSELVPPKSG